MAMAGLDSSSRTHDFAPRGYRSNVIYLPYVECGQSLPRSGIRRWISTVLAEAADDRAARWSRRRYLREAYAR